MPSPLDRNAGSNEPPLGPPHGGQSHHIPRYKFTLDEMRVLRECNRESFYYRCVPIGTTAMIIAHYAVKTGYLSGSPKYGSLWKVLGAGVLGYFVGKFSYRSTCEAKIMQLPNSQLAEALKRRKQGLSPFPEIYTMDPTYDSNSNSSSSGRPLTSFPDSDSGGTWDIDEDKNIKYSGLDESQRPTIDNSVTEFHDTQPAQSFTNYDTLRKQNREEYEAKRTNIYHKKEPPGTSQKHPPRPSSNPDHVHPTNKYGDAME